MLNDFMGLTAFECEPAPMFASLGPATVSAGKRGVLEALSLAAETSLSMSPQEEMAYSLYSASCNESHADPCFVMEGSSSGTETPSKFFTRCYEMRRALVHGHYPRPTPRDVSLRAAHLEQFVGDVLVGDIRAE